MRALRDTRILLREVWLHLALFAGLLLLASLILKLAGCYGDAPWGEVLVKALYMSRMEGAMDGCGNHSLAAAMVYVMPVLTVLILGEGALRLTSLYLSRRFRSQEWEEIMVSQLQGHIVLCGAGELGRSLLVKMRENDDRRSVVVVDTRPGVLHELGIHDEEAHHIHGDMTSRQTLELANVARCSRVILASGNDAHNLDAAALVRELNPHASIWVRLYHPYLQSVLKADSNLEYFCPYVDAADNLLRKMDPQ